MKNLFNLKTVILLLIITGLGCRMFGGLGKGKYFEGENAKNAIENVKGKIGKPFKVAEIMIEENEIRIQVQDPNNSQNLDEYKIANGFLTGPNPVKLNAMQRDLENSTFPIDQINFDAIPNFIREALEKSKIEGAKISRLNFQRAFALREKDMGAFGSAYWQIQIEGTRESVTAAASPDGKLLGIDLSRTNQAASYKVITPEELQKAQDALKKQLGEENIVTRIVIDEDNLVCSFENPQNPQLEESFNFGINGLTKTKRDGFPKRGVRIFENFSLSSINLSEATNYLSKARQRIEIPDAVLTSIKIFRKKESVNDKEAKITWNIDFKKGVNEASVVYNNEGKEIRFSKNGQTIFEEKD